MSVTSPAGPRSAPAIDLYLGGDLGGWVLEQVRGALIRSVFTYDDDIAAVARDLSEGAQTEPSDPGHVEAGGVAVCVHYPKVFPADLIARYRVMYNLHPGYLPWGRGFYPVFWALWEETPAGATLHEIEPALDKGPVVMQIEIPQHPDDTGGSLHARVRDAERRIFQQMWPEIAAGNRPEARPPSADRGSYHSRSEFLALRDRAPVESLTGSELLKLIRALTFPGVPGLRIRLGRRSFHARLDELQ